MEFLDHHLNPLVRQGKPYVKDTNHILRTLGDTEKVAEGELLCTMEVAGFYPCIPHEQGIEAMKEELEKRGEPEVAMETLVELASLV